LKKVIQIAKENGMIILSIFAISVLQTIYLNVLRPRKGIINDKK